MVPAVSCYGGRDGDAPHLGDVIKRFWVDKRGLICANYTVFSLECSYGLLRVLFAKTSINSYILRMRSQEIVVSPKAQLRETRLAEYVSRLQSQGRYTFSREEALNALGVSQVALQNSSRRLAQKGRLVSLRAGLYLIVPHEYRAAGAPPPAWFINDLMRHLNHPYYVGLLSAAAIHGVAHQQPQEFQVVTDVPQRPIVVGRVRIRFVVKKEIETSKIQMVKTETGAMRVSTVEVTALDLVHYPKVAGHLGNVATVLIELAEQMDSERLVAAVECSKEVASTQRLGYLLEFLGYGALVQPLAQWLAGRCPRLIALRPDLPKANATQNKRWKLWVNEYIDIDL